MFDNSNSKFHAKTQRKSLFFAPLRLGVRLLFPVTMVYNLIPRIISTRTDLCITARVPAWEPSPCKFQLDLTPEAGASHTAFPSWSLGTSKLGATTDVPATANMKLRAGKLPESSTCTTDWLYRPWPGFRHPCRNDGFSGLPGFVYNDEWWAEGRAQCLEECANKNSRHPSKATMFVAPPSASTETGSLLVPMKDRFVVGRSFFTGCQYGSNLKVEFYIKNQYFYK